MLSSSRSRRSSTKALGSITADAVKSSVSKESSTTLLQDWIAHSDASYHHFSKSEATEIREALLTWYRGNRRKLPWRGDPPPYDGSTAGINNTKNKPKDAKPSKQSDIKNFFQTSKQPKQEEKESKTDTAPEEKGIPMSSYGVWVSEIMLQQTRVEAVIPYWIKCT
jgi:A/G-specific adenine glycosylase